METIRDEIKAMASKLTLLYVEDLDETRDICKNMLDDIFYRVYIAENGRRALESYRIHAPNIIITDIVMPSMSGIEMIQEIRSVDDKTPIVVVSAYPQLEYLKGDRRYVDAYMTKPFNINQLLNLVLPKILDKALYKIQL